MNFNAFRASRLCAILSPALALALTGCFHHHEEPPVGHAVIYDDRGFKHEGEYDANHDWHGGYKDDRGDFHADSHDWHQ